MAKKIIKARMKQRTDTKANWTSNNPVLLLGELGMVSDDPNLYKVGDGITAWNALPFRGFTGTIVQETGTGEDTVMSQKAVTEKLTELSDKIDESAGEVRADGNYPNMSVGFAANLIGRGESIASEIGFRASGGKSIEDGSARITELQGNAVVWNQLLNESKLVASDATITKTAIGYTITPSGSAPGLKTDALSGGVTPVVGHKYALLCVKIGGTKGLYLNWGGYNASFPNPIFSATDSTKLQLTIYSYNETETFTLTTPRLIDLTKMFGSGNEPTTIDEFYNRMPQGINVGAYNEGQLIPSNADGIKSVGDNAWDEKWENGIYNTSNGAKSDNSATIRSKNMTKVLPNTQYYCYVKPLVNEPYAGFMLFYDADKNYIGNAPFGGTAYKLITTPTNAMYMNFYVRQEYGATYSNNINIYLAHSGYKQDVYYSHKEFIKTFDYRIKDAFPDGMMPWDKVYNKNGKGYIVFGTGKVDLGSLNYTAGTTGTFYCEVPPSGMKDARYSNNLLCGKYATWSGEKTLASLPDKSLMLYNSANYPLLGIRDSAYTDATSFKAAMSGVMLYYELATPTIIEYAEPFNLDYEVWDFGTEEMLASEPSAPIKALIRYQFNAVDEVRELRQMIVTLQATIANL